MTSVGFRYGIPAALAALAAAALAGAQDMRKAELLVERRPEADGREATPFEPGKVAAHYERTKTALGKAVSELQARVGEVRERGYDAGLAGCRIRTDRSVRLREAVPEPYQSRALYFVRVPRSGSRPGLLPPILPKDAEVFILQADRLSQAAALSRALGRRVTLARAEFANAVGVRCADARVTFSEDGRTALVHEEAP